MRGRRLWGWDPALGPPAPEATPRPPSVSLLISLPRAFLAAALAQGLCEVLLVVTKEVEEKGCWLRTD